MAAALSSAERGVRIRVIAWPLLLPGRLGGGGGGRWLGNTARDDGQQGGEQPPGHWSASHKDRCLAHGPKP